MRISFTFGIYSSHSDLLIFVSELVVGISVLFLSISSGGIERTACPLSLSPRGRSSKFNPTDDIVF